MATERQAFEMVRGRSAATTVIPDWAYQALAVVITLAVLYGVALGLNTLFAVLG